MQRNYDYEGQINLKSLFFSVLFHWRSILVAALIGAVILGTFQYVSLETTHRQGERTEEERQYEIDLQTYHTSLETYQKDIETYTNLIKARKDYRDNSPYLKLDPQNIWIAERRYFVEVDPSVMDALPEGSTIDPTDYVLSVYASAMREEMDDAELQEVFGTTNLTYVGEMAWVSTNANDNTLSLDGRAATPEDAEKQLAYVVSRVEQLYSGKAQEINPHKLVQINESVTSRIDSNVLTSQNNIKNEIAGYQKTLDNAIVNLNKLEIEEEPEPPGNHIKKMAAIGFIVGAFLLAGIHCVAYVLNGRFNDCGLLVEQYNIPLLGEFYSSQARRPGTIPDKWFEAWERGKTTQDNAIVASHIVELLQAQAAGSTVLMVSTEKEARLAGLVQTLSDKLDGVKLVLGADFLHNEKAVSTAAQADAVIVVEEKGVSYLKNIDHMAALLISSHAKVIGAIVL